MSPVMAVGLYRSGTNFTQRLIDLNLCTSPIPLNPHTLREAYKHAIDDVEAASFTPEIKTVLVYKTPDRWLKSLQRLCYEMPFLYNLAWEEGHTPIEVTCDSEYGRLPKKVTTICSVEKLLELYRKGVSYWMERADVIVNYVDILFDPEYEINRIAETIKIGRKEQDFTVPRLVKSTDDWNPQRREEYRYAPSLDVDVQKAVDAFDFEIKVPTIKKKVHRSIVVEAFNVTQAMVSVIPAERKRDWFVPHTYKCLPVILANEHGWDIVANEDITFEDVNDQLQVSGCLADPHFGMKTFTLPIGYTWKSPYNVHMLLMPVPNEYNRDWVPMSAIIETDSLKYPFFLTIKTLTKERTVIPAGTKLARVMPVTLADNPVFKVSAEPEDYRFEREANAAERDHGNGKWLRFYHDRVKYKSNASKVVNPVSDSIIVIDDFLTPEQCETMVRIREENPADLHGEYEEEFWAGRCHRPKSWPDDINERFSKVLELAKEKWGGTWEAEDFQITTWPAGYEMPPHEDYAQGDFPHRDFAAVIYFNTNYEGGEIYFPDLMVGTVIEIKPDLGTLLLFRGGDIKHGVRKITSGERYTAITWLTRR